MTPNAETVDQVGTGKRRGAAVRRLALLWSVLAVAWLLHAAAAAQEPHWDDDDYLVAHEGVLDVYDHDFTFKHVVPHTYYAEFKSLTWSPDGWLRTAADSVGCCADMGPNSADSWMYPYRLIGLNFEGGGTIGDIKVAPDGALFVSYFGAAPEWRGVRKFVIGPDRDAEGIPFDVRATGEEVAYWTGNSQHMSIAIVPDETYGYLVWAGSTDYIHVLKPDLTTFVGKAGVVDESDGYLTTSMYYDPETNTVVAGREVVPDAFSANGTLVGLVIDATTRAILHRLYVPYIEEEALKDIHRLYGITRGKDGIIVAADSGHAKIHIWDADGNYVRSFVQDKYRPGEPTEWWRQSGNIVWAGNRPTPVDTTAPTTSISLSPAAPSGANGWYVSPVTVQVSAADETGGSGLAETRCSAVPDSGAVPGAFGDPAFGCSYTGAGAAITADGEYTIYAGSTDTAGNIEAPLVTATVKVDTTPPTITCQMPAPEFALNAMGAVVNALATDGLSGPASVPLSAAADTSTVGAKTVPITAVDAAGNRASVACSYTVVDTRAPVTSIALSPPAPDGLGGWYVSPVHVTVSAADPLNGSGVVETRCGMTSGHSVPSAFADLPGGCAYGGPGSTIEADGIHTVVAGSRDAADNIEAPLASAVLRIDRTGPVIACPSPVPEFPLYAPDARMRVALSDALSGVTAPEMSVAVNASVPGSQTVEVQGADRAGNHTTATCTYVVRTDQSPVLGVPDPPAITALAVDGNFVTVQWRPATTGAAADAYLIEIGDGPGQTTVATYLSRGPFETGLLPEGEYYLRVRALNAAGLSSPSPDVWTAVKASAPVAGAPVAFHASVDTTTVHLAWQASTRGAAPLGYRVEVGTDAFSGNDILAMDVAATTTELTVPNVPLGTYVVRVRAITGVGPSPPSPALWIQVGDPAPCATAPSAPVMLTPLVSDGVVSLWWRHLPPPRAFVVQAGSVPGASDLAVFNTGPVSGMSAAVGDGQYAVRALADTACGVGPASSDALVTVGGPVPAPPTDLVARAGAGAVTFTWTPPAAGPAATHYVLEAGLTPGTTLVKLPTGATPTVTIAGLPPGITFVARVRAANAGGIGPASAEVIVTVQ